MFITGLSFAAWFFKAKHWIDVYDWGQSYLLSKPSGIAFIKANFDLLSLTKEESTFKCFIPN